MKIIPAILEKNFNKAEERIRHLSFFFKRFQIDVADNQLVPNSTLHPKDFKTEKFSNLSFDFHLMVKNPSIYLETIKEKTNINVVFVHLKPAKREFFEKKYSFDLGIALSPEDSVEEFLKKFETNEIKHLLILTVNPGFQGGKFLPEMLKKVEEVRALGFSGEIYLDGGINEKTINHILPLKNLINFLCIGSYLTKQNPKNLKTIIGKLENL